VTDCNAVSDARSDLFWRRVDVGDPDACWPWSGGRDSMGYASTSLNDHTIRAHRLAYLIAYEDLPPLLRHTCDNPMCCNPEHVIEGTQADNIADKVARNRQATGDRVKGYPAQQRERDHCKWGHKYTPENTSVGSRGERVCRACGRRRNRELRKRRRV
jgi:hypothetical protein